MGIRIDSMYLLLWIVLQWTYMCMYLYNITIYILLWIYPVMGLQGHLVFLLLELWGSSTLSSTTVKLIYIPANSVKMFLLLSNLNSISCFLTFYNCHSDWCKMECHCGFDLYFSNDQWCLDFCHPFVDHVNVFFWEVSVHVLCPLFDGVFIFL